MFQVQPGAIAVLSLSLSPSLPLNTLTAEEGRNLGIQ